MIELTDDDVFPFGKYRDSKTMMKDVPASYLDWLAGVDWLHRWPALAAYIEKNRAVIDKELEEQGRI